MVKNIDAEQAVLGAVLSDARCYHDVPLVEADFYSERHKILWTAIQFLAEKNRPIDIVTVSDQLRRTGASHLVDPVYVTALPEAVATTANVAAYAHLVSEARKRRDLIRVCQEGIERAENEDLDAALSTVHGGLLHLTDAGKDVVTAEEASRSLYKQVEDDVLGLVPLQFMTGVGKLDRECSIRRTDLVVLGGWPGSGKSTLLRMALFGACERVLREETGKRAMVVTLEMPPEDVQHEMAKAFSGHGASDIAAPKTEAQLFRLGVALEKVSRLPIDYRMNRDAEQLIRLIRAEAERGRLEMVAIDYLQRCWLPRKWGDTMEARIGEFTNQLKQIALRYRLPVFLLSSLNRPDERQKKEGLPPNMTNLRGSGQIEHDADIIMFTWQDEWRIDKFRRGKNKRSLAMLRDFENSRWKEPEDPGYDEEES